MTISPLYHFLVSVSDSRSNHEHCQTASARGQLAAPIGAQLQLPGGLLSFSHSQLTLLVSQPAGIWLFPRSDIVTTRHSPKIICFSNLRFAHLSPDPKARMTGAETVGISSRQPWQPGFLEWQVRHSLCASLSPFVALSLSGMRARLPGGAVPPRLFEGLDRRSWTPGQRGVTHPISAL